MLSDVPGSVGKSMTLVDSQDAFSVWAIDGEFMMASVPRTIFAALLMLVAVDFCHAQVGNNAGGTGGFGGGFGGGNNQNNSSGIRIDAQGVVSLTDVSEGVTGLDRKRRDALAKKHLSQDLTQPAAIRMVSLVQLEKQLEAILSQEAAIPDELFYLAGLQRIDYLFVFPEEHDLVIAGPAEGFVPDSVGRMIGVESTRPTLRLDDLIIALRSVPKSKQIGCSIDPVASRIAELQKFIRQGVPATQQEVEDRFNQMDEILGLQDVRIDGVPNDSHFAIMLVEADYRMKRIALGLENPAVKGLKSHLAMLGNGANVMQRWWFVPFYDAIHRSENGLSFQFVGQRAQLLAEDEVTDAQGHRTSAATTHKSTHAFAKQFTQKFAQLADKSPVFGELQNLIDWVVVVSLLQQQGLPEQIGWKPSLLMDPDRLKYPTFETPKQVPSLVSYKRTGNLVVGLVGGGVTIRTEPPLALVNAPERTATQLETVRTASQNMTPSSAHRWWWDSPTDAKPQRKK